MSYLIKVKIKVLCAIFYSKETGGPDPSTDFRFKTAES